MYIILIVLISSVFSLIPASVGGETPGRAEHVPVIVTGWDSPNTKQFREGLEAFEQWGIFDGTTIRATRHIQGEADKSAINAFSRDQWLWSEFSVALADLRAAKPKTCRETYLMIYSNPGDVDWFDEAGWQIIVDHWRLLARLAKQGGLRGILFDAEPYTKPYSQYLYQAQPQRDRHSFSEYQTQARKRGREVMTAFWSEFPDATLFTYRLFSDLLNLVDSGNLSLALEPDTYGLLPAFVDGWLDVMPATMYVIEGTEDIGYRANSFAVYSGAFTRLKLHLSDFVAPEHREKVRRQFRIGQSLYLDAYVNPPSNPWYIDSSGSTPSARLAANLASALSASDGIVWLYGEQARWWNTGNAEYPLWPDKFPGVLSAIRQAKDPIGFTRELFRHELRANLLENGDFTRSSPDGPPTGWFQWQDDSSHGRVACTDGHVELRAMLNGVVGRAITVQPGKTYALRLRVKSSGRGLASLSIGWKNQAGEWTAHAQNRNFVATSPADHSGWREILGLVEAPPAAVQLVFMGAARAQTGDGDSCWFDDAAVVTVGE